MTSASRRVCGEERVDAATRPISKGKKLCWHPRSILLRLVYDNHGPDTPLPTPTRPRLLPLLCRTCLPALFTCCSNLITPRARHSQIHLPATLLLDVQALYPKGWLPGAIAALPKFYADMSGDPLIGAANGFFGDEALRAAAWFRSFLVLEACVLVFVQSYGRGS